MNVSELTAVRLLGVPVHAVTMQQALAVCQSAVQKRQRLMIGVVNAAKLVNMRRQPVLREAVVASDLVVADGMAVVWAARILGRRLPERVTGIDLFENLLGLAERHGFSVYFLGAAQDVLDTMLERLRVRHPALRIAGSRNGYFTDAEAPQVADAIHRTHCDMLFVAMSSPKKEVFLAEWGPRMDIAVCHGVGGSFDVLAGKVKRAPVLWQKLGLEWFYRFAQEPRRMWRRYLVTNTLFVHMVLRERLGFK